MADEGNLEDGDELCNNVLAATDGLPCLSAATKTQGCVATGIEIGLQG